MMNSNQGMKRWPGMLILACGLVLAGPVSASGKVAVEDSVAQERIKDVKEQIKELQKRLVDINDSKTASWKSLDLTGDNAGLLKDLGKLSDADIIKQINWECGGTATSVPDLLKRYALPERSAITSNKKVKEAQEKICQHHVATRLWRHNLTVQLYERLKEHEKLLNSILEKQDIAQRNTDLAAYSAIVQTDLNYTQAALAAYDGRLTELNGQRTMVNDVALGGPGSNTDTSVDKITQAAGKLAGSAVTLTAMLELADTVVNWLNEQ